MKRRDALKTAGLFLGYSITAGTAASVLNGCSAEPDPGYISSIIPKRDIPLIKSISETILPGTDELPGAKDIMIEKFIDITLKDFNTVEEQNVFLEGLSRFKELVRNQFDDEFQNIVYDSRLDFIKEQLKNENKFVKAMHEMTIIGFCTSEIGSKQVLVFDPIPGAQKGCIPLEEVGGIWAI